MSAHGKVSLPALVLIAAVVGGIWAVILFSPAVVDNFDVQEEIAVAFNRSRRMDDDQIRNHLVGQLNRIGTHYEEQFDGSWAEVPGLGITRDNVVVFRDTVQDTIRIEVDYVRQVKLKPLQAYRGLHFTPSREGKIP